MKYKKSINTWECTTIHSLQISKQIRKHLPQIPQKTIALPRYFLWWDPHKSTLTLYFCKWAHYFIASYLEPAGEYFCIHQSFLLIKGANMKESN